MEIKTGDFIKGEKIIAKTVHQGELYVSTGLKVYRVNNGLFEEVGGFVDDESNGLTH